jgi:hypothetical protein
MIGGWRPWQRWMVARRLARHARREGGEPPADLLRRLREDIPASPALLRHPDRPPLAGGERRGGSRRWLAAASLAAALTAVVVGLRVWEEQPRAESRRLEAWSRPGAASAYASRQAKGEASPPPALSPAPPSAAPASPPVAPEPSLALPRVASTPPSVPRRRGAAPALPPLPAPMAPADAAGPPPRRPAGRVRGEPGMRSFAEKATGASGVADQTTPQSAATAGDGAAQSLKVPSRDGASRPPGRSASTAAAPSGAPANEAAPAERAGGAAPPVPVPPAVSPPPPAAAAVARPELSAEAKVAAAPPASSASRGAAPRLGGAAPLRSSFGADTGTDFYRRVRRGLLADGRLPRAASVRADELANAFDLAADVPAVGRPELAVEGAPLPAAGATYLVRFEARGLAGRSSQDTVEVDFDPAVVARFRRVGATAHRGGAAALYEIELRPEIAAAPTAPGVMAGSRPDAAGAALAPMTPMAPKPVAEAAPATAPQRAAAPRMKAASPQPTGEPRSAAASRPAAGADRVIATLRVMSRDEGSFRGGALLAARVVRLDQLHPSWDAASPALRVQGLAVQLARALAARDPGPRLQEVRVRAQALAAELPEDPKAAELLQLVDRAADLAAAAAGATPHPP